MRDESPYVRFIFEQPLASVGLAAVVGYVLAGGLFTKTTRRLLGLTWKVGGMSMVRNFLGENIDAATQQGL